MGQIPRSTERIYSYVIETNSQIESLSQNLARECGLICGDKCHKKCKKSVLVGKENSCRYIALSLDNGVCALCRHQTDNELASLDA